MVSLFNSTPKMPLLLEDVEKGKDQQDEDENCEEQDLHARTGVSIVRSFIIVGVLTFINLVTFIAAFTFVGAISYLQSAFKMDDSKSGLISLVFTISSVLFGQIYGYLGDRWNRKYIMCAGMSFWSAIILCKSYVPNEYFTVFLLINGLSGAAEASFKITAPSIIADVFVGDRRSRALNLYYLAAPFGCGLGYIIGSKVTSAFGGAWQWAFRIISALGLVGVLLMAAFVKEPSRGAAEEKNKPLSFKGWLMDANQLRKNRSLLFSTLGTIMVKFVAAAFGFWAVTFLKRARALMLQKAPYQTQLSNYDDSLIFGGLTVISGILGVGTGAEIAKRCRKYNPRADPIVCAVGLLGSAIFLLLAIILADISLVATYVFIFIGTIFLSLNFSVSTDIRLYVVSPTRRSTAQALSMAGSHLLGEAGSSYFIGLISDRIKSYNPDSALSNFRSLQYALMVCPFVLVFGGGFFFACALFVENDRKKAETESEDFVLKEEEASGILAHVTTPVTFLHTPTEEVRTRDLEKEQRSKFEGILNKCSMDIIVLTIDFLQKEITNLHTRIASTEQQLSNTISSEEFTTLKNKVDKTISEYRNELQIQKKSKFLCDAENYLNNQVSHPGHIKRSLPKSQHNRVDRIVSTADSKKIRHEEMNDKFRQRGYPSHILNQVTQPTSRRNNNSRLTFVNTYHPFGGQIFKCIKNIGPCYGNLIRI
ncbi:protein spinster homolog 1-like [Phyllobates terribilis]|uniref:protein spinster homolog 1-like n=1 Tax=Phyllobates terribilis TaxID=111132 RepID=UPI003CCAFEAE